MFTTALPLGRALPSAETTFRILPRYWRADVSLPGLALCAQVRLPGIFWLWLTWAGLEVVIWLRSTDHPAGFGEIRHLLLIAALFLVIPALDRPAYAVSIWPWIFLFSTLSSVFLIGDFIARLVRFGKQVSGSADPSFFLRSVYPEERRFLLPLLALQSLAIFLSLTRMLWLCCLLLLILHLAWRHSK